MVPVVVPVFKGKGDIKYFSCCRAVKFLEREMKVVEGVLEKRLRGIVTYD